MKKYIFLFLLIANQAMAEDLLANSLSKLGIMSNVNKPGIVSDQLGGYMTGGSMHVRTPNKNANLFNIQLPSMKMGCGGIDLFSGGFGYINSAQLEALMKNIGSSAISYSMMLTLKTISPQIADLVSQLESMARFLNGQNINSCQIGASIAAGLWPKNAASQELGCQAREMGNGAVGNYFTARFNCSQSNKAERNRNEYNGLLGTEFNLVWHALKKQNPSLEKEKIELLMSISGTLISQASGESVKFIHKGSLLKEAKLLEALIYGGAGEQLTLYDCRDSDKCLDMTYRQQSHHDGLISQVKNILSSIADKFLQETSGLQSNLSDEEKNLVQTSSVPILKIISLEAALKGHSVGLSVEEYAEMIAFDYLTSYLDNMLDQVYQALSNLEYSQMESESIKNFKEEVRFVKAYLLNEKQTSFQRMNTLLTVKQRMLQIEQMIKSSFAEYRDN